MKKGGEILVYPEWLITPPRPSPTIKGANKQKCEIIFKEIEQTALGEKGATCEC